MVISAITVVVIFFIVIPVRIALIVPSISTAAKHVFNGINQIVRHVPVSLNDAHI